MENNVKLCDVIILSWDRLNDTIEAIKSALNQKDIQVKVTVIDQGSKPENLKQLREFCSSDNRITLACNGKNTGVPFARNQASFTGETPYIIALDNDAVFETDYDVLNTVDFMDKHPEIGVLAYRIKCFDKDTDDLSSWPYSINPTEEETTREFETNRYVGAGHCIRRDVFEKLHGYDDDLFFMHEEVDFSNRVINAGYKILYTPTIAVRHKVSPEHRVSWNGNRYYFDVRNRTYMHVKHGTAIFTMIFHTALLLIRGIKKGYGWSAIKGLCAGIALWPTAIKHRFNDLYVTKTSQSEAYFEKCNPLSGVPVWKRILFRLKSV